MANNAYVTIVGNVKGEPKSGTASSGQAMLMFNMSVLTSKKLENPTNPKYPYASDLYGVTVFGRQAEALTGRIKQQTKLLVSGDMNMGKPWQDREGVTHISPQVNGTNVMIVSGGNWNNNNAAPTPQQTADEIADEEPPF